MVWRIGELLDFDQQLAWVLDAGFDGIGFHASAGDPGNWCGIDPASCDASERDRLRQRIGRFAFAEVHAPFAIGLQSGSLSASVSQLRPVLDLAHDLGAGIVTVHAEVPPAGDEAHRSEWHDAMQKLDRDARRAQTRIALEIASGFETVAGWYLPNVGVTLDVGHMYLSPNRHLLEGYGGIRRIIRRLGGSLFHLHVHDVNGDVDHVEIGTGCVEFGEIAAGLDDIGYDGGMCLEMNPERVSPDGIRRSLEYLRAGAG